MSKLRGLLLHAEGKRIIVAAVRRSDRRGLMAVMGETDRARPDEKGSVGRMITVSVVRHRNGALLCELLADLNGCCAESIEVILTLNVPETMHVEMSEFAFPLKIVRNTAPRGFGANHNAAFRMTQGEYFCVVNPAYASRTTPSQRSLRRSTTLASPRPHRSCVTRPDRSRTARADSRLRRPCFASLRAGSRRSITS